MQRHVVKEIQDLISVLAANAKEPQHLTIENVGGGVLLSDALWEELQSYQRDLETNNSTMALEKAVSLLIQESQKAEQNELAVARREQQFVRIFSTSLTPMRIEDWSQVKSHLATLAKRYNPIEIKELLLDSPQEVKRLLQTVKIVDCNQAFCEAIDAEHNPDYLGALDQIIPQSCYAQMVDSFIQLTNNNTDIRQNIKLRRFDGGMRDVQMHMSLYSEFEGGETKMLVSYWDVTQQKRITRHLQNDDEVNEEDRSRSLLALNSIREGVITTDQQGQVINLNPTAKRLTGWESDYFQRPLKDIFEPVNDQYASIDDVIANCQDQFMAVECDSVSVLTNKSGEQVWLTFTVTPIVSDESISGYILIFHDVSESKQLLDQIKEHKNQDPITKLLNRQSFKSHLNAAIKDSEAEGSRHALLLVDLDQFHVFNDTCGHTGGDILLKDIAEMVSKLVRSDDVVARIGGDEFGILLSNCATDAAIRIAQNILEKVENYKFSYQGKSFNVGASIGIVVMDATVKSVDQVLIDAGSVVEVAKENGSHRVQVYDAKQEGLVQKQDQVKWFTRLTHALENDLLVLSYQKICPTNAKDVEYDSHYEILIRMLGEGGELIQPGEFLPAAERYNLMPQLDRWVVKNAFRWIEVNLHRSQSISLFSINLSGHSLGEDAFLNYVEDCFKEYHVPGDRICFEITESMAINNMENTLRFIERFKDIGCKFSLDDFGTGFSSYGYLKTLPVDFLKIDGSFVRRIAKDPIDYAMVKSINEVGHVMNRKTIAEYVENDETMQLLREIGVDYAQGYGIETPQLLDACVPHQKLGS